MERFRLSTTSRTKTPGRPAALGSSVDGEAYRNPELDEIFGPPPLIRGENLVAYQSLYNSVRAALKPTDVIDELSARDLVDVYWDILRLRRLRAKLLTTDAHLGVRTLMEPLSTRPAKKGDEDDHISGDILDDLALQWLMGDTFAVKQVNEYLKEAKFDNDAIMAQTLSASIDDIERWIA